MLSFFLVLVKYFILQIIEKIYKTYNPFNLVTNLIFFTFFSLIEGVLPFCRHVGEDLEVWGHGVHLLHADQRKVSLFLFSPHSRPSFLFLPSSFFVSSFYFYVIFLTVIFRVEDSST